MMRAVRLSIGVAGATAFVGIVTMSCRPIAQYWENVPPPKESLLPPSAALLSYTDSIGLTLQLERSTRHCSLVRHEMAREIDARDRRLGSRRQALLIFGSAAALANTIYAGIEEEPRKEVLVPLGAVSGGALLTAIPILGKDERADALREKSASIRTKEALVVADLQSLERGLLDLSLIEIRQADETKPSDAWKKLQASRESTYVQIAPLEDRLRAALSALSAECS